MPARLNALATAVPPYVLEQDIVAARAKDLLVANEEIERMLPVFANAGISRRFSAAPLAWFEEPQNWKSRNARYLEQATNLLETVTLAVLEQADLPRYAINALVVVSTTGIATPGLDARLIERLDLRPDVRRLPIFGLGCGGGVQGLSRAAELALAHPKSRVLFLVVELCTLQFRRDDGSKSATVATALFGDGAAGALISTTGDGPAIGPAGEFTWPQSLDVMGWDIEEDGMRALFSASIPGLVRSRLRPVLDSFLRQHKLSRLQIDQFACHPGGAKVLDALEEVLELTPGALVESRQTLRDYGNMSAATVLFVLSRLPWRDPGRTTLLTAMGPGFTAAFQLLGGA